MVTISASKKGRLHYGSSHIQYALTNIVITFVVLLFLNIYASGTNQQLIYQNKKNSMLSKCQMAAAEIADLEVLNPTNATTAVNQMGSLLVDRIIITDQAGLTVYDSLAQEAANPQYMLLPEIAKALDAHDVFSWDYHDGNMFSRAATPIVSYGTVVGCVYMMESDPEQGLLIQNLQTNIFTITLVLELAVIIFSFIFSAVYSSRLRQIMASMRIIREGDYTHKVSMGGQDELTVLGHEFNDLTDRLQTSENKRRQFVSDASHELKTPLASIKLLSDSILQNDMDIGTIREFVGDIGNEADRLNRMSSKLLSLTRIESQVDGTCEIVNFSPTVDRVVRMLSGIAQKSNITIVTEVEEDCPILILEDDLYQITFNLAENGIKYNIPGGTLTIRVYRDEENGFLEVSDSGVGIPEDAIGHVFERFYRVDKARSRKSGGSGLGLAIVRNMVERNQGTIRVSSVPGQGSTFTVSFPAFDTEEEVDNP